MNKSNTIRIVTIVSFFIILYLLSFFIRFPFFSVKNVEAIPVNTLAFFEISNDVLKNENLSETALIQNLNSWSVGQKVESDLEKIKELVGDNVSKIKTRKLSIAIANGKADEIDFLYVVDRLKKKYIASNNAKEYTYLDQPIYELELEGKRYTYAFYKNIFLFARYSVIVEDAINQLEHKRTNLCSDSGFKRIYKKRMESNTVQFYLNPSRLTTNWKSYFEPAFLPSIASTFGQTDWTNLSISAKEKGLGFAAQSTPNTSNQVFRNLKKCGQATTLPLPTTFPNNTSFFELLSFEEYHFIETEKETTFNQLFKPWIGSNVASLMTEPYNSNFENEQFMVLDCVDTNKAQELLFGQSTLPKLDYMSYSIGQIDLGFSLPSLFGFSYKSMQKPYFTILDKQVVFAHDVNALKGFLDKYTVNQTLSNEPDFIKLWNQLTTKSNAVRYVDLKLNAHFLNTFIKDKKGTQLKDLINVLVSKKASLSSIRLNKKSYELQIYYDNESSQERNTSIAWRTALKSEAASSPQLIDYRGETAIFIQDTEHRAYLINKNGQIIWERSLDAPILSDLFELDYYQNGEDYYLFNTKNNIYLVDGKGDDVRSYPFGLKSPMSNGLIAIDFDGTQQFDYFVACENRNIYGFDQQGKPLSGWNPNFKNGIIRQNFKHFQYQNKDYLVSVNTGSKLQVYQRNGKPRFNPVFLKNSTAFDFENIDLSTRIVALDNGGRIRVINAEGKSFRLGLCNATDQSQQFCFADMIGDERNDYFQLVDSTVCCKYYDETILKDTLKYTYEHPQDTIFGVAMFGKNKAYLGSLNAAKSQVSLLNDRGQLCSDFPLAGTTSFVTTDLFQNEQNILIVGNGKSIYAYQLSE